MQLSAKNRTSGFTGIEINMSGNWLSFKQRSHLILIVCVHVTFCPLWDGFQRQLLAVLYLYAERNVAVAE